MNFGFFYIYFLSLTSSFPFSDVFTLNRRLFKESLRFFVSKLLLDLINFEFLFNSLVIFSFDLLATSFGFFFKCELLLKKTSVTFTFDLFLERLFSFDSSTLWAILPYLPFYFPLLLFYFWIVLSSYFFLQGFRFWRSFSYLLFTFLSYFWEFLMVLELYF